MVMTMMVDSYRQSFKTFSVSRGLLYEHALYKSTFDIDIELTSINNIMR